jgi:hypothetical protein
MRWLDAMRSWPVCPEVLEQVRATPEWAEARAWGWVMETGELTGIGSRHAWGAGEGILPHHQ